MLKRVMAIYTLRTRIFDCVAAQFAILMYTYIHSGCSFSRRLVKNPIALSIVCSLFGLPRAARSQ